MCQGNRPGWPRRKGHTFNNSVNLKKNQRPAGIGYTVQRGEAIVQEKDCELILRDIQLLKHVPLFETRQISFFSLMAVMVSAKAFLFSRGFSNWITVPSLSRLPGREILRNF
jgi:hypothetical protein